MYIMFILVKNFIESEKVDQFVFFFFFLREIRIWILAILSVFI